MAGTTKVSELTAITTTQAADSIIIADSSDSDATRKITIANFESGGAIVFPVIREFTTEQNQKNLDEHWLGELLSLSTADSLSTGVDITVTNGISKIAVIIIAGSDTAGTITVTGTSVDRDTGVEVGADTDTLTISGVSVNTPGTDGGGNVTHDIVNGYLTSKWFKGSVTLSTTDVTLTDVNTYSIVFDQFDDNPSIQVNTFDFKGLTSNVDAAFYGHLYTVVVTGDTFVLNKVASLSIDAADVSTNKYYRLRKSSLATTINGVTDGVFASLNFHRDANQDWLDVDISIHTTVQGITI